MNKQAIKKNVLRFFVFSTLGVILLAAAVILMYTLGRMWVVDKSQLIMQTTTIGTSIQQTQKYLGPPLYEKTKSEWEVDGHADAFILPEGTSRIVVYTVSYSNYCYLFLNSDGFILGSYWWFT